jgi:hypothetical protein
VYAIACTPSREPHRVDLVGAADVRLHQIGRFSTEVDGLWLFAAADVAVHLKVLRRR